ncbi:GIGANTEA [Macleaya cordata]|uniref:GIGANTEA n=1 Tax=Macleaya cordata TaxID=56857 RepID=A0A200QJF1_MACCD|nr:GIGANTEA [Macleaya cordata]
MTSSSERWIDSLQFTSLFWPPPEDAEQRKAQITAYVEYFGQFTSDRFSEDIAELIRSRYPSKEKRLFDEVLAIFVLHHPEHGHAVVLPIISCITDGTLVYNKNIPPFSSFISLVCPSSEEYSEQWALACGEILRILTHYNRPIYKVEHHNNETERCSSSILARTSNYIEGEASHSPSQQQERKPSRLLSPWITDILLAAPLGIRSDYFRWCGGVTGKYAASGELQPPTAVSYVSLFACGRRSGKHPQLVPSTPRWAVANGAGVILSVCDEEVTHYETAILTAAAVPALLLPPPTTALDEHLVAGLPALEPYARLFHRYYAIATPSATQRLLLGLLEAPPSWAPDALDAAVQLVELLRAAEDYAAGMRLPRNWMHLHFLHAIGIAMSMRAGIAANAAAALLFRILSQPALLFPPLRQTEGVEIQNEPLSGYIPCYKNQIEIPAAAMATTEATAQGIASMLCAHGPEVEWRICTIWEAAYGLIPLSSSAVDLPEIIVSTPLQPPVLSWNLYLPLLKVFEYLPRGSPSEACLMRIFVATVEAILQRTFPPQSSREQIRHSNYFHGIRLASKNLAVAELRTMVHSLFLESCASIDLASRLLFVVLTVCVSQEARFTASKKPRGGNICPPNEVTEDWQERNGKQIDVRTRKVKKQGPVAAFDSYVLAAVCALSCELQLFPMLSRNGKCSYSKDAPSLPKLAKLNGSSNEMKNGFFFAIHHTHRLLGILEALFSLKPSSIGTSWSYSSNEIVAAAMVAAHISELFRQSKACMHALYILMQCKWDNEIYTRASSLYNLIDIQSKAVASIVDKAEPLEAQLTHAPQWKDASVSYGNKQINCSNTTCSELENSLVLQPEGDNHLANSRTSLKCEKTLFPSDVTEKTSGERIATLPTDASDLANFLAMDRHIGFNCSAQVLLRSVLAEKQELCFSVVSLLWHKLIAAPETQLSEEGTSAQQGWRQVVDALSSVVSASPSKASTAIVLQAEKDLQPWIAEDDEQGQKMWRINQRIVKLIVELMRNHDRPESLVILASASDLLLRATDGMLVDGEACTLPQLELLEATARAIQLMLEWGDSSSAATDGLTTLLKFRLPATVCCISHPSAHVRARSISVLRDILLIGSTKYSSKQEYLNGIHVPPYRFTSLGIFNWHTDIEKCLTWEAHSRQETGMTITFLETAAKELGCTISI